MSKSREKLIEQAVAKSGAKLFKVNADTLNRAPRPAQLSVTVIDEKPVVDIRPGDYQRDFVAEIKRAMHETSQDINAKELLSRDSITRDLSRAAPTIEQVSEVLRAFGRVGIPTSQAVDAFRSASLHVQMVGRALRYRPYTWRMTRGKQPRRVKVYARVNRPHVIDYGVEPRTNDSSMALRYALLPMTRADCTMTPSEFQRQYEQRFTPPHVGPPVVRDARFQSIVDNWEPKV